MGKHIAITGNIGSGKTTVCREFERLGVPVYYADARAKALMHTDTELVSGIQSAFGREAYLPDGRLDRKFLADRVFNDPAALAQLNGLVHPAVARDAAAWFQQQSAPYSLHEAAIVMEIGIEHHYDAVVVVACPHPIRKRRVMARDGVPAEAFERRAANQWSDEKKEAAADYLIYNDGKQLLLPQLLALDRQLTRL